MSKASPARREGAIYLGHLLLSGPRLITSLIVLAALVATMVAVRLGPHSPTGSIPQGLTPAQVAGGALPTKPWVSVPPQPSATPITLGPCSPGSVAGTLTGWGVAMGTDYAYITLRLKGGSGPCSLPRIPAASESASNGATSSSSVAEMSAGRIALASTRHVRVALAALCPGSSTLPLIVTVDFGGGVIVRVSPPPSFDPQSCGGAGMGILVDDLAGTP